MRFFNTAGPNNPAKHYTLPLRLDFEEIRRLINQQKYFLIHAPRQTGKSTAILEVVKHLNKEGKYAVLYINIEGAQVARDDVGAGMASILVGDTLVSLLRQLRSGYTNRPHAFPQCIALIGLRDIRDYRIWSAEKKSVISGGSCFNIKAESLRFPDFNQQDIVDLYQQHTVERGQKFTQSALERVFSWTAGQPWLVNAIAYYVTFENKVIRDKESIDVDDIDRAVEALIVRRDTHLDVLIDRLHEERVRRVLEPILLSKTVGDELMIDDMQYCIDGTRSKRLFDR